MNVLIIGAGASRATHCLPTATEALSKWERDIRDNRPLLALALDVWVGQRWSKQDLESTWTQIDIAWKERQDTSHGSRLGTPDLTHLQRKEVWRLAFEAAAKESDTVTYYRERIKRAQAQGHSTEQFLSVVAGWEFRKLIQRTFDITKRPDRCQPYRKLLDELQPAAVISFNYDTLLEQCLESDTWTYRWLSPGSFLTTVLKPHGSVNWTWRLNLIADYLDDIDLGTTLPPAEMGYHQDYLAQNLIIGLRAKIEHTSAETRPRIREHFHNILGACSQVLTDAEKISIVGYRFAPADTTFLDLLAQSLACRTRHPSLAVIGYGSRRKLLRRIRYLFDTPSHPEPPHCFCGFEMWATHGFCHP